MFGWKISPYVYIRATLWNACVNQVQPGVDGVFGTAALLYNIYMFVHDLPGIPQTQISLKPITCCMLLLKTKNTEGLKDSDVHKPIIEINLI